MCYKSQIQERVRNEERCVIRVKIGCQFMNKIKTELSGRRISYAGKE